MMLRNILVGLELRQQMKTAKKRENTMRRRICGNTGRQRERERERERALGNKKTYNGRNDTHNADVKVNTMGKQKLFLNIVKLMCSPGGCRVPRK